jgi:hypothetical protein
LFLLGRCRRLLDHPQGRVWHLLCRRELQGRIVLCRPHLGQGQVQHLEQPAGIKLKAGRAELQGLPAHQLDQAVRQLIGTRHPRPIHQDRDHPNLARQSRLDLQPNKIIGVVKATPPMRIGDRQPLVTDERHQHITGADRSGDHLDEVITQLDRVDVLEDLPAAEAVCQPVVQPAGRVSGLLAPVADEDPTRRGWRTRTSHYPPL